jgi:hypothetical protein
MKAFIRSFEAQLSKIGRPVLLPLGEGGAAKREPDRAKHQERRRMRATRPTISSICRIVERAPLTRRCRATLSQREGNPPAKLGLLTHDLELKTHNCYSGNAKAKMLLALLG